MTAQNRNIIFPSSGALYIINNRLNMAKRGHGLLRKKSDGLWHRARNILDRIIQLKKALSNILRESSILLAETKYFEGAINTIVLETVGVANTKVSSQIEYIIGVQVPVFIPILSGNDSNDLTGLGSCGQRVMRLRENYKLAIEMAAQLASLQSVFLTLNNVIKITNRRVNGIGHVIIPRLKSTIAYVESELDEKERENLYRLKLVRKKQLREKAISEQRSTKKHQKNCCCQYQCQCKFQCQCKCQILSEKPESIFGRYEDEDVDILF